MSMRGSLPLMPLWVLIKYSPLSTYPYLLISLPRKIGLIFSATHMLESCWLEISFRLG